MIFHTTVKYKNSPITIRGEVVRNGEFWTASSDQFDGFSGTGQFLTDAVDAFRGDLVKWLDDRRE